MFRYFKTVVFILKFISSLVVLRNYGKINYLKEIISNKFLNLIYIVEEIQEINLQNLKPIFAR